MIPRRDSNFYKIPKDLRALYMTGMPSRYLDNKVSQFHFKNEKNGEKILSSVFQEKIFQQFKDAEPGEQQLTIFNSFPTDHEALTCCSALLKKYHAKGFREFEFVHPSEFLPRHDKIKGLYVLLGCHAQDDKIAHLVRKWVRTPLGASIWLILTSSDPLPWSREILGITPDYLFSLKKASIPVG